MHYTEQMILLHRKQMEIQDQLQAWALENKVIDPGQQIEFRLSIETVPVVVPKQNLDPYARPVSDLNLLVRSQKMCDRLKITTVGELIQKTADQLLESKNFGMFSLNEIREKLWQIGLNLRGD